MELWILSCVERQEVVRGKNMLKSSHANKLHIEKLSLPPKGSNVLLKYTSGTTEAKQGESFDESLSVSLLLRSHLRVLT